MKAKVTKNSMFKKHVIVRADRAGVFFGILKSKKNDVVVMTNVRKIWYWNGANAIEQIALDGIREQNKKDCKLTVIIDEMEINGVIQVIPATQKCIDSLNSIAIWKL